MFPSPLYFVTDSRQDQRGLASGGTPPCGTLLDGVTEAIAGGVRLIQYRDKDATRRAMYDAALQIRRITQACGATLIINDYIDLALAVEADGVHLGQDDLPVWTARKILGNRAILGVSTHNVDEALAAQRQGANYVGLGPIFATPTKPTARPPLGVAAVADVARQVTIPIYAIGGIHLADVAAIRSAGATGVAAISALSGDIRSNVAAWIRHLS